LLAGQRARSKAFRKETVLNLLRSYLDDVV